jgi:hypothetical protein
LGNKRGRRNKRRNTKFLEDLEKVDSPHKERDLIGQDVDVDLLSLFPQIGARIMVGLEGDKASQGQQWSRERIEEATTQWGRRPLFIWEEEH